MRVYGCALVSCVMDVFSCFFCMGVYWREYVVIEVFHHIFTCVRVDDCGRMCPYQCACVDIYVCVHMCVHIVCACVCTMVYVLLALAPNALLLSPLFGVSLSGRQFRETSLVQPCTNNTSLPFVFLGHDM